MRPTTTVLIVICSGSDSFHPSRYEESSALPAVDSFPFRPEHSLHGFDACADNREDVISPQTRTD